MSGADQPKGDAGASTRAHRAPLSNRDFDFFYEGLEAQQLLVQSCEACGLLRCPPGPACPRCRSLAWRAVPLSGRGILFSFTVHHYPPLPDFATPLPVGLAVMDEGVRMLGPMDASSVGELAIGLPVVTEFVRRDGVAGYRFRPAAGTP
jgi:uncharacterized OB-fold protein